MEGRLLLGLGQPEDAIKFLVRQTREPVDPDVILARDQAAREARRVRGSLLAPEVTPPPPESQSHWEAVKARPLFQRLFSGITPTLALITIAPLIPVQPHVHFGYAIERVRPAVPDFSACLELCVPSQPGTVDYWGGVTPDDHGSVSVTIGTRDLNLGIVEATFAPETLTATFRFGRTAVFSQVVRYHDRYYLKDGTHRAVGLLAQGVQTMPVLLWDAHDTTDLPDYLPPGALLGAAPPRLADFLDPALFYPHAWVSRMRLLRMRVDDYLAPLDQSDSTTGGTDQG